MKRLTVLLLLLSCAYVGFAQTGRVIDEQAKPLAGVTIRLYRDSTLITTQTTDLNGNFMLNVRAQAVYRLTLSAIGYQLYERKWAVGEPLTNLILKPTITALREVTVASALPAVTMSKGKLTYNVAQSAAAAGSTVLDLMRKIPGVNVDQDGNIILKGSSGVNVMLDGHMTYVSGQQLARLLEGMNAESVSKIEVTSTPSAEFDAAGNAGIINVVTKKQTKPGYAASFGAGATVSRYLLHNESITGNVRTDKFNIYGSFGYAFRRRFTDETSTLLTSDALGNPVVLSRAIVDPNRTHLYNYKLGTDLYLNSRQQIGFSYTGTLDDWSKDANGTLLIYGANTNTSIISEDYAREPYYKNIFNFNYQFKIDTTGKTLSADADYISYRNFSDGFLISNQQQLNFNQPNVIHIRSVNTDLVLPFKQWKLKAGLKYADVATDNTLDYDSVANGQVKHAASLSDHFVYRESIAAAYIAGSAKWQHTEIDAGLRAEHTYTNADAISSGLQSSSSYLSFFPSLSLTQNLNADHQLDFSLSRRINRPSYTSLNPVRFFNDAYSTYQGNPLLIAEMAWKAQLSYTLKNKYIVTLSHSRGEHFIAPTAVIDPNTNVLILSTGNFPHRDRTDLQLIAPFSLTGWWQLETSADLSYTAYPVVQREGPLTVHKVTADLYAGQTIQLPGQLTFEFQTRYTTPELNGIYIAKYYFSMDGGLKKTFNKKLDARFAFADLLHTGWYWGYSLSNLLPYQYKNTPDSRRFGLTLTYHIGGKLNTGGSHRTEEQDRL